MKDCVPNREEELRKTLSNHKKILDNIEQTARERRTNLRNAKWFKCNKTMSKQWFSLNKTKKINATIKSLFRTEGEHKTEDPNEMLGIARHYHSQLQSEPTMTNQRLEAIENILTDMEAMLTEEQKSNIKKKTQFIEVCDIIRTLLNGKAPGPDGISNEFWKTKMSWCKKAKEKKKQQPLDENGTPMVVQ